MNEEAEGDIVTVLLDLALLAEAARTPLWQTKIYDSAPCSSWVDPYVDDDNIPLESMPLHYLNRAKEKANQLGVQFMLKCDSKEKDMERIREVGGGVRSHCIIM